MAVQDYNTEGQKRRFFKMNAKECKLFESVKDGDEYKDVPRKNVEWKFVKIELWTREYEGKTTEVLKLTLKDGEETYEIGTSWTLWQQLINSLAGEVKKRKLVNVSVWVRGKKTDDGKERPRLSIHNNAESMEWLYSIDQQKEMVEIIKNKKWEFVSKDNSTYIDKLKEQIAIINENSPEDAMFDTPNSNPAPLPDNFPF